MQSKPLDFEFLVILSLISSLFLFSLQKGIPEAILMDLVVSKAH